MPIQIKKTSGLGNDKSAVNLTHPQGRSRGLAGLNVEILPAGGLEIYRLRATLEGLNLVLKRPSQNITIRKKFEYRKLLFRFYCAGYQFLASFAPHSKVRF